MCFVLLISLCQECQTLIENHDQIKLLSNARNNLNTTLKVGSLILLFYLALFMDSLYTFISLRGDISLQTLGTYLDHIMDKQAACKGWSLSDYK